MKTTPKFLQSNGFWNNFTGRKRYIITCGQCGHTYKDKVYFSQGDEASSICPNCNAQNIWSHAKWERFLKNK